MCLNPATFHHPVTFAVSHGLRGLVRCGNGGKATFAESEIHCLWWEHTRTPLGTWEFQTAFRARHIPQGL